jgi:flagellin-specific chaperone FliS
MKLYDKCIKFVKCVATTIPNDQVIKIKVAHLQKLYTFVVEPLFI